MSVSFRSIRRSSLKSGEAIEVESTLRSLLINFTSFSLTNISTRREVGYHVPQDHISFAYHQTSMTTVVATWTPAQIDKARVKRAEAIQDYYRSPSRARALTLQDIVQEGGIQAPRWFSRFLDTGELTEHLFSGGSYGITSLGPLHWVLVRQWLISKDIQLIDSDTLVTLNSRVQNRFMDMFRQGLTKFFTTLTLMANEIHIKPPPSPQVEVKETKDTKVESEDDEDGIKIVTTKQASEATTLPQEKKEVPKAGWAVEGDRLKATINRYVDKEVLVISSCQSESYLKDIKKSLQLIEQGWLAVNHPDMKMKIEPEFYSDHLESLVPGLILDKDDGSWPKAHLVLDLFMDLVHHHVAGCLPIQDTEWRARFLAGFMKHLATAYAHQRSEEAKQRQQEQAQAEMLAMKPSDMTAGQLLMYEKLRIKSDQFKNECTIKNIMLDSYALDPCSYKQFCFINRFFVK